MCTCVRAHVHTHLDTKRGKCIVPHHRWGGVAARAGCTCDHCLRSHPWWADAVVCHRVGSRGTATSAIQWPPCQHYGRWPLVLPRPRVEMFGKACALGNIRRWTKIHFYHKLYLYSPLNYCHYDQDGHVAGGPSAYPVPPVPAKGWGLQVRGPDFARGVSHRHERCVLYTYLNRKTLNLKLCHEGYTFCM
jgi:hypothetical protein